MLIKIIKSCFLLQIKVIYCLYLKALYNACNQTDMCILIDFYQNRKNNVYSFVRRKHAI